LVFIEKMGALEKLCLGALEASSGTEHALVDSNVSMDAGAAVGQGAVVELWAMETYKKILVSV